MQELNEFGFWWPLFFFFFFDEFICIYPTFSTRILMRGPMGPNHKLAVPTTTVIPSGSIDPIKAHKEMTQTFTLPPLWAPLNFTLKLPLDQVSSPAISNGQLTTPNPRITVQITYTIPHQTSKILSSLIYVASNQSSSSSSVQYLNFLHNQKEADKKKSNS